MSYTAPNREAKVTRQAIAKEIYYLNRRFVHTKERNKDSTAWLSIVMKLISRALKRCTSEIKKTFLSTKLTLI